METQITTDTKTPLESISLTVILACPASPLDSGRAHTSLARMTIKRIDSG